MGLVWKTPKGAVFLIKTELFSPIPVVSIADELFEMETSSFSSDVVLSLEVYR